MIPERESGGSAPCKGINRDRRSDRYALAGKRSTGVRPLKYIVSFKFYKRKRKGESYPVIAFSQYKDERKNAIPTEERRREYAEIFHKTKGIIDRLLRKPQYSALRSDGDEALIKCEFDNRWDKVNDDTKDIFLIWFYGGIPSETVCAFVKDVVCKLKR